ILDALDRQGVADQTLVIFTSDNGGVFKPRITDSLQTKAFNAGLRVNGDLRGGKHDVWEGGFKVAMLVRWPGKAPAGTVCDQMISLVDVLATTAEIVGEELPPAGAAAEDSRSFLAAIVGDPPEPVRQDLIVHSSDGVFAIRKGPWKLIEGVPVDQVKPAARKLNADQYRPQLYNTEDDPAETTDVSAAHSEVVRELGAFLDRYRDGGYSRELPPVTEKQKPKVAELPALAGQVVLDESLEKSPGSPWTISGGQWAPGDGGLWGAQGDKAEQGAVLRVPLDIIDGAIEYEINFKGANRHSLRVEWGDRQGSFRFEVSRTALGITKNPSQGEGKEAVEPIARKVLELEPNQWYPVRITFRGAEATLQVNDVSVKGTHAVLGKPKTGMNFLVFGETAGIRKVQVAR
ncbi:MAG: sulfatase-like hydrolase/transferase, partial [Thermoguttaceae bacterium]